MRPRSELLRDYERVRSATARLCEPLEAEDMVIQTMPDVSPTKWHIAHVTWFFEAMVLERHAKRYVPFDERFPALFNSYYQALGTPFPRARRGMLSRPTVDEIWDYRRHVDEAMAEFLATCPDHVLEQADALVTVGLNHEEQHHELVLMDVKHVLAQNPLRPTYREPDAEPDEPAIESEWCPFDGGEIEVGAHSSGFAFDNERPRHIVQVRPFELASTPVTAGEYQAFISEGGYDRSELWLSDGWDMVRREGWRAPQYWDRQDDEWSAMTLGGFRRVDPAEPVCHVSYYEADAYSRWAGCRLPSEFEWEHAATDQPETGTFLESARFHPQPARAASAEHRLNQVFGDVWEWTSSPYAPYPGFEPFSGAIAEYNGKFMINQLVLRGGCCVTPGKHVRRTYRNFFYPHQRWMFAGLRLAR